ncbi:phosphatidylglycerophosphatase A [bacterium]|nr:phosphatidylglycerophosphatase A [bacterium]
MKIIKKIIATFLGAGYSPIASGTVGSFFAAVLIWFLPTQSIWYVMSLIVLLPIAAYFCSFGEKFWNKEDASQIVFDEVIGMGITYAWMPKDWRIFVVGFFLFRIYDILKIPPANAAEKIKGGWGVLLDDVVVGIYANIGLWILRYFLHP